MSLWVSQGCCRFHTLDQITESAWGQRGRWHQHLPRHLFSLESLELDIESCGWEASFLFVPDPPIQQLQPRFGFKDREDAEPRRHGALFCDEHGLERGATRKRKMVAPLHGPTPVVWSSRVSGGRVCLTCWKVLMGQSCNKNTLRLVQAEEEASG